MATAQEKMFDEVAREYDNLLDILEAPNPAQNHEGATLGHDAPKEEKSVKRIASARYENTTDLAAQGVSRDDSCINSSISRGKDTHVEPIMRLRYENQVCSRPYRGSEMRRTRSDPAHPH
jgi:hypothetical protein